MNDLFANIYELWGGALLDGFSNDMYTYDLYLPIGLTMVFSTLAWMVIYYYLINHPRFNNLWSWLLWLVLIAAINFGASYYISTGGLDSIYFEDTGELPPYYSEFYTLSLINACWAIVFAIVWSFVVKWWSVNCRRTPA